MTDRGPIEEPVEVTIHIAARPETVFAYFTDPARHVQWLGMQATLDPVPGGTYRVQMPDGVTAAGTFVEVDPPRRLVFTWDWTADPAVAPGSTRVVVTLEERDGGTRVVLRHHDLPDEGQRENHRKGWQYHLDLLRIHAAGGAPRPDPDP